MNSTAHNPDENPPGLKRRDFLSQTLSIAGASVLASVIEPARAGAPKQPPLTDAKVRVVGRVAGGRGGFYSPNRAPLQASPLMKLPIGSIAPGGWLLTQLQVQAEGLNGRMTEVSDYLDITKSGWMAPENNSFEEVPYWLRGFVRLGYVLKDARIRQTTKNWVDSILKTQQVDGYFGPIPLKTSIGGKPDTSIASGARFNDGHPHLAIFTRERASGDLKLWADGQLAASGRGGMQSLNAPAQLGLGAQTNGAIPLTGEIGEVQLYARFLSGAQRQQSEQKLMKKWVIGA
ncbi:MAG: hypothetical protein M3Y13_09300 [Armatimonadota bacterium]|nr:hypothetical protein [Armatimonadota bacterium]